MFSDTQMYCRFVDDISIKMWVAKDKVDEIFHGKRPYSAPELFELRHIFIELGHRFGENFEACLPDATRMVWAFGRSDHQASRPLGS